MQVHASSRLQRRPDRAGAVAMPLAVGPLACQPDHPWLAAAARLLQNEPAFQHSLTLPDPGLRLPVMWLSQWCL